MVTLVNANDPRVRRTRQLLQQAFTDLVHEQSFEAITVQDIAERATLNRATFYAHFADKYALLDATIGASFAEALLRRVPVDADMSEETIRRLILAVCDFHQDLSRQCKRSYQALESPLQLRIITHLHDIVRASLARTPATHPPDREVMDAAATVVSWSIYGAVQHWNKAAQQRSLESYVELVLPLIVGNIAPLID